MQDSPIENKHVEALASGFSFVFTEGNVWPPQFFLSNHAERRKTDAVSTVEDLKKLLLNPHYYSY